MNIGTLSEAAAKSEPIALEEAMNVYDLPTPSLVLDLDAFEANVKKMADLYRAKGRGLRPHAKTHKCPIIAKKQIEAGAIGICAAKVAEAEVMVEAGIEKILITSPVVTRDKIGRVVALASKSPGVQIVIDNEQNARDFNEAAAAAGVKLGVFVDIDPGLHRTGIAPGEPALKLAQTVSQLPSLEFAGLQFYDGRLMHRKGFEERKKAYVENMKKATDTKALIEGSGIEVPALSCGGTGTYNIDCDIDGVTDVQVGSYIFMDVNYRAAGGVNSAVFDDFQPSLFVLATAISQPAGGMITFDCGFKAMSPDSDLPQFRDVSGVQYLWGGDEHGIVLLAAPSKPIKLGDKLPLIVSHCDPTVNLYDHLYAYRGEQVEAIWPIAARGKSQ